LNVSRRGAYFITADDPRELEVGRRFHTEIGVPRAASGSLHLVPVSGWATVCRLERMNGEQGVAVRFDRDMELWL